MKSRIRPGSFSDKLWYELARTEIQFFKAAGISEIFDLRPKDMHSEKLVFNR